MILTKRLCVDRYREEDQQDMIELLTNDQIKVNYMIPDFPSRDKAVEMFHKLKTYSESKEHYERGIYLEHKLIGFVNDVMIQENTIELGYVIHPVYQGKGYATEALGAVIKDLFDTGYEEIITGAFENNTASIRVMEKCGMKKIDKEEDISYHNVYRHCIYYSITKTKKVE